MLRHMKSSTVSEPVVAHCSIMLMLLVEGYEQLHLEIMQ